MGEGEHQSQGDFGTNRSEVNEQSQPQQKTKCKFRETSNIPPPSERLQQGADSPSFTTRRDKRSAYRAERTGTKLEAAKQKQAKQKPPKKPGPIKSLRRTVQHEAWRYTHGKIYQAERENIGIEAAHRTELVGESMLRKTSRFVKQRRRTRPARRVHKWEKRDIRANANLQFRKIAQENPELKKSALSRLVQKQRMKRKYQKQARETAKRSAQAAKKTAVTTEKIAVSAARFFAARPISLLILGLILLIVITLQACMGLAASLGGGGMGNIAENADTIYTRLEQELMLSMDRLEADNPGCDEYRRDVAPIGHDPAELLAFMAVCDDFSEEELETALQEIFDKQYQLTSGEAIETQETVGINGEVITKEIRVFEITLTVIPFDEAAAIRLTPEQLIQFREYLNEEDIG